MIEARSDACATNGALIAQHAATVLVGQLAVMAFGVTDTIVAGRYAEGALAALSVGSAVFVSVYVSLMGGLQALLPVWAELHGAGRTPEVGRSVRQSLYLCAGAIVIGMALLLFPAPLLRWTEVPLEMRGEVEAYLRVLAFALAPALLFRMFSTLNQSLGRPKLVTWLQLASLRLKLPLSVWFAFGGAGLPAIGPGRLRLGHADGELHDALRRAVAAAQPADLPRVPPVAAHRAARWPAAAPVRAAGRAGRTRGAGRGDLLHPDGAVHRSPRHGGLGRAPDRANLMAVGYMLPLSLSLATSARVSYWLGAGEPALARRACRRGFELTGLLALVFASTVAGCAGSWRASTPTTPRWWRSGPRCCSRRPSTTWRIRCRRSASSSCAATA